MVRLRELAQLLPRPGCEWEKRPTFSPPSSPDVLEELERLTGFPLPTNVREFFAITDAVVGMSVHNGYQIGGAETLAGLIQSGAVPRTVPDGPCLPVALDGGGNVFLLSAPGRVWRWGHEAGRMSLVADSFGAFIERVVADWRAYVNDTSEWAFLV